MAGGGTERDARIALGEIRFLEELMRQAGVDCEAVLTAAGHPPDLFERGDDEPVSFPAYFRLMEHMSDAAGDETVTASARRLRPGTAQLVLSGLSDRMPLAAAMTHIANAYNVVHAGDYNRVIERADRLVYAIDDRGFPFAVKASGPTRHAFMESVLVFLQAVLCELCATPLNNAVLRIDTRRPSRTPGGAFLKPWRAPIRYGASVYAIHFAPGAAQVETRPLRETAFASTPVYGVVAQRVAAAANEDGVAAQGWREQVRAVVQSGEIDQPRAAAKLGVSVASLRRRLAEEGATFRAIKAEALNERAKHLLACGHTVREVAELLAFSDTRSFSRAFKALNRITPSAYQTGLRARGALRA